MAPHGTWFPPSAASPPPGAQVLSDRGYDGAAADIWSCGVVLFVLLAGYLPFDEPDLATLYRKVR